VRRPLDYDLLADCRSRVCLFEVFVRHIIDMPHRSMVNTHQLPVLVDAAIADKLVETCVLQCRLNDVSLWRHVLALPMPMLLRARTKTYLIRWVWPSKLGCAILRTACGWWCGYPAFHAAPGITSSSLPMCVSVPINNLQHPPNDCNSHHMQVHLHISPSNASLSRLLALTNFSYSAHVVTLRH
jgi:hypothetical protein